MTSHTPRRTLLRNFAALAGAHALGVGTALVTVPYLARVLRPEGWAPVLVAQALANWLIVVLEFGFDLSGTRDVARARHVPGSMAGVVHGVQSARLLLVAPTIVAFVIVAALLPAVRNDPALAGSALAYALCRGLSPLWYFQGMERMRRAVAVDAGTAVLAALGVFAAVRGPGDGWRVLALQAAFAALSLVVLTAKLAHYVPLRRPDFRAAVATLRASRHFFALRVSSGLYLQANSLVLAAIAAPQTVAFFGGAERLIRAAINLYQPLTRAIFPRVSFLSAADPDAARRAVPRLVGAMALAGLGIGVAAWFGAPALVRVLLGPGYEPAVPLLRALAPLPLIVGVGTALGIWWALPFGRERAFMRVVVAAGVANIVLALLLVPRWGGAGMAASVVIAEGAVAVALAVMYRRWRAAPIEATA